MTEHDLDPELQWIVTEARRPVAMDPAGRVRLMEAVRRADSPRSGPRVLRFLRGGAPLALSPFAAAGLAAALLVLGFVSGLAFHRDGRISTGQQSAVVGVSPQLPDSQTPRVVKFVLIAPAAQRVSLVGDFNGWDVRANPMTTRAGDGRWTVFVPLQPGMHVYSFLVDGTQFIPDPTAPTAPDDGFGTDRRNSVVVVGASSL